MTSERILVAGANGRLGSEIMRLLGNRGVPAARSAHGDPTTVLLTQSGVADQSRLSGVAAIINCAGAIKGTAAELNAANVAFARSLAEQARTNGVGVFVQVSSFSVFGACETIRRETPVAPDSAYGRSKAAAEEQILSLASETFRPLVVRLPFMFSSSHPGLIGTLIKVVDRIRIAPLRSTGKTLRSMLTYADAARVLTDVADRAHYPAPRLAASDPVPLDLQNFISAVSRARGKKIVMLRLPKLVEEIADRFTPGFARRVLRSSVLSPEANCAVELPLRGVQAEIDRILGSGTQ